MRSHSSVWIQYNCAPMRNSLLPVVFFSLATAAAASPDRTQEIQDLLGWVNQELLTPEQRAHMPAGCCGMFVEPEITPEEAQREETEISGNSSQGTEDNAAITGNESKGAEQ